MRILALDAALARASIALWADGAVVAEASRDGARGGPAVLPALAAEVLGGTRSGERPDAVAVGVGPGGFTGIRSAIALAQGLALGWGVPVVGVTTGEALAAALGPEDAGREAWAVTAAGRGGLVLERAGAPPVLLDAMELPAPAGPVVLTGDAVEVAAALLLARGADVRLSDARLPRARDVAAVAARWMRAGGAGRAAAPLYAEPIYVRAVAPPGSDGA